METTRRGCSMKTQLQIKAYELLISEQDKEIQSLLAEVDRVMYLHLPSLRMLEQFIYDRHGYAVLYEVAKGMDEEYEKEHGKAYGYARYVSENYDQD